MRSVLPPVALVLQLSLAAACQRPFAAQHEAGPGSDDAPAGAAALAAPPAVAATAAPSAARPGQAAAPGPAASAPASQADPGLSAEAARFYSQRCSLCHGPHGHGDGVAAQNLRPRPRSFAQPGWQAQARDDDIALIIVRGGSAVGRSMMMPASTDLADKPQLVRALVQHVRRLGQPQGG